MKESDGLYRFEHVFEALLVAAVRDGSADKNSVNAERLEVLKSVYNEMAEIIETDAKLKLYPRFNSGGVLIEIPEVYLDGDKVSKLRNTLCKCDTFEIVPLSDGRLSVSVTTNGVFDVN